MVIELQDDLRVPTEFKPLEPEPPYADVVAGCLNEECYEVRG